MTSSIFSLFQDSCKETHALLKADEIKVDILGDDGIAGFRITLLPLRRWFYLSSTPFNFITCYLTGTLFYQIDLLPVVCPPIINIAVLSQEFQFF